MRKFLIILICFWANLLTVFAQKQTFETLNRNQYLTKVKLVEEFVDRFNGVRIRPNLPKKYSDRKSNVLFLFDLAKFKSKEDKGFQRAETFAKEIADSNYVINLKSKDSFASINCHGTLDGKQVFFKMFLILEERDSSNMYKWAISNVKGKIFETSRDKEHKELFIMPNDHEQFFSSVRKVTTEAFRFVDDYTVNSYKSSPLDVFLSLVRMGKLKIDYVDNVTFTFLQIPHYLFKVKYFERDTENSGWLIDSVEVCPKEQKLKLLNDIR